MGVLRAMSVISVGCIAYGVVNKIIKISLGLKAVGTISELLAFGSVLYIITHHDRGTTDFLAIMLLFVGVVMCFSGRSQLSLILEKAPLAWISDFSKALYLNQYVLVRVFQIWKIPIKYSIELVIYILLSVLTSLACVYTLKMSSFIYKKRAHLLSFLR